MSKVDHELGEKVEEHLKKLGIETPLKDNLLNKDEKRSIIQDNVDNILWALGLDLDDDSLVDTPKRVAKMFVDEIYTGLDYSNFPKATTVENKMGYDQMVLEKDVTIMSTCEHHLVTISGIAHIAYIPNKRVLGLSKLNRIADFFAKRPQIQERLTQQIGETLSFILETSDVAVVVDAQHFCVRARGVRDTSSSTTTSFLKGGFRENMALRQEFFSAINK